jgi:sulfane dehydrogenase subunit SoxC
MSKLSRRALLIRTATGAAAVLQARKAIAEPPSSRPETPDDPTKIQGRGWKPVGERSPFEQPERLPYENHDVSTSPLQALSGIITPADLHFERHHGGVPAIDPERYRLLLHGMVERPTVFTLAELKRFPSRSQIVFVECSGNGQHAYRDYTKEMSPQHLDGLTSTSEWTGVPLAMLFREVGVKKEAQWFLAEGQDAAVMTRSIPMEKAWDDAMIAYGQNGEALRPEQGYPARLLLPGWEGNAQVKWIRRIEVSDQPFMTREETSKYSDPLPDCTARMFSFEMDAKSVITFPAWPATLPARGFWEITGLAWSGRGRITRVEVSTDGGATYAPAALQSPVLPKCHTRFRFPWNWRGGEALLMSRATDETGYVQPTLEQLRTARGLGTKYHFNHIRAWRVDADGRVFFGLPSA